jgi:hypothetical protein
MTRTPLGGHPDRPLASRIFAARLALGSDKSFFVAMLTILLMVLLTLFAGLVVQSLWNWFIIPLWPRPIGYGEAVGLSLIISYARGLGSLSAPKEGPRDFKGRVKLATAQLMGMVIFWGIAALFHLFAKLGHS